MSDVPVLDLKLKCGEKLLDVSLWRDEALSELHEGDHVHLSHLRATILPSGNGKLQSSNYTTIKVLMIMYYTLHSRSISINLSIYLECFLSVMCKYVKICNTHNSV